MAIIQYQLAPGRPLKLFNADAGAAPVNSPAYAVPEATSKSDRRISWTTLFASAPASASIILQGAIGRSLDDTLLDWKDLDTSTSTTGEIRSVLANVNFIRVRKSAQSGGGALTVEVLI